MIDRLRIRNFKAWHDTGEIRLAPLTVVFGTNSSGKSSLHQLLLMLRQTVESPDRRRVLHTGDSTTPVDLGSFRDLIADHDATRQLGVSLEWPLPKPLRVVDAESTHRHDISRMRFDVSIDGEAGAPRVEWFRYTAWGDDEVALGLAREPRRGYRLVHDGYTPVRTVGRPANVGSPDHFHGFPDALRGNYRNLDVTADLSLALEERLRSIAYLGPLREAPNRWYRWSGEAPDGVGWQGQRVVDALLSDSARRYNLKPNQRLRSLQELTAARLVELGVVHRFSVTPIAAGRDEYEVRVAVRRGGPEVLLTDVGFGVSQVLPVVVAVLHLPPHSTLVLEQPEIHLHPAAQSELADLFLDALRLRRDGGRRHVQLIVETHSEHVLRRLLRRRAEGVLDDDEVALYFVEEGSGKKGSELRPLEVDEFGDIRNWPANFFGDAMGDIAAQARAARDRRRKLRGG